MGCCAFQLWSDAYVDLYMCHLNTCTTGKTAFGSVGSGETAFGSVRSRDTACRSVGSGKTAQAMPLATSACTVLIKRKKFNCSRVAKLKQRQKTLDAWVGEKKRDRHIVY